MLKTREINTLVYIGIIGITLISYFFTDIFCKGSCYPFVHGVAKMAYIWLLGLIPTLALFIFFGRNIFVSWIRHIAWWFAILVAFAGRNLTKGILSPSEEYIVIISMAVLFVITLVYAIVMSRKHKQSAGQ